VKEVLVDSCSLLNSMQEPHICANKMASISTKLNFSSEDFPEGALEQIVI
jgi:hypothetical protein